MRFSPCRVSEIVPRRLLRLHPLRTADSLQLAAALIATNHQPQKLSFVCNDARLSNAARKEGFTVIDRDA